MYKAVFYCLYDNAIYMNLIMPTWNFDNYKRHQNFNFQNSDKFYIMYKYIVVAKCTTIIYSIFM